MRYKTTGIVTAHTQRRLRQVIRPKAKELRVFGDFIRHQSGPRNLKHRSNQIIKLYLLLLSDLARDSVDDVDLQPYLFWKSHQWNHDLRFHLYSPLLDLRRRFENCASLHFGDLWE